MELILYYILPNVALFGSLYVVSKGVEHAAWYFICNYDNIVNKLQGN